MADYWIFLVLLPLIAFLYSAVGHGGASGYLALMAFFSFSPEVMRTTALLLNLFVAGIAFMHYWRAGYFKPKLFYVFAISSIPFSFYGGSLDVEAKIYKIILGVLLIFAVLRMLNVFGKERDVVLPMKWAIGLITGAVIGFFSGLIGIGGGIILSPVILLLHWGRIKEAAAVSALFIWVNSAAGLAGQLSIGIKLDVNSILFVILAMIGAYFGGYYGSRRLNNLNLRYLLAFVLVLAAVKLLTR